MNRSHTVNELVTLVSEAVTAVSPDLGPVTAATSLVGESAVLDSVGLVTLLVTLEERLNGAVDLASSFMAHENPDAFDHPFRTIGSLAAHVHERLPVLP